jgi:copper(I)-binding protein
MRTIFLAAALLAAAPALAQAPAVEVTDAWARATAPTMKAGGAYMTLTGKGAPDRLVGASTPVARMTELHRTVNDNGVMKMLPVDGIGLKPGETVEFKPGGYHVMLMGLRQQLKPGDTFPLTLTFANSPPQTVTVTVGGPGAMGPGMPHMHSSP